MAESTGILLLNAEDNSESGLTITEEGSNNFSITTGSKAHGTYGYNFAFSGNSGENLCNFYKAFTSGTDIYARCYFYIPSGFSMNSADLAILALYYNTGTTSYCVRPIFSISAGVIKIGRVYYRTNSGTAYIITSANTITRDTWHYLEIRYKSGTGDGSAECWLDGNSIAAVSSLTNDTYTAALVRVGSDAAAVPTSGSVFYVDDIKIDSSAIGAYAESGGSTGGLLVGQSALVGGGVLCGQGNLIN